MTKLSRQQELEIYPLLDKVLELPPGKAILRQCSLQRADYLARMITGLVYDTAIESIEMYEPNHPLHGSGSYGTIWAELNERGLLVTRLHTPPLTLAWQLINVAATRQRAVLIETRLSRIRQRLARMQRKYPQIMSNVWVSGDTDPPEAYYGELGEEETHIVDIDLTPEASHLIPSHHDHERMGAASLRRRKP